MSTVFGEVAALYDEVRPEHPAALADTILAYAGGTPASAVEIGAGTGKSTALFAGRGFPITCLEPDPRMAERLLQRFPDVTVESTTFEDWQPPAGGVPLLFAALVWHWLTPVRRAELAARALAPGGTLAIIGRKSSHADPAVAAALDAVFGRLPGHTERPPMPEWAMPELAAQPELTDLRTEATEEIYPLPTEKFLALHQTYAEFRNRPEQEQAMVLEQIREVADHFGGVVDVALRTTLVLARHL